MSDAGIVILGIGATIGLLSILAALITGAAWWMRRG